MLPQLYVPSVTEIMHAANSAKRRHPELAARISKAADILVTGSLQLDAVAWQKCQLARWRVASQSGKGTYVVSSGHCPCEDSHRHGENCKHSIALALYSKILRNHVNADIRARQIDLGILETGEFHAYAKRLGIVDMKRDGMTYTFCNAASAVRYSMWAATQPVAVEWPVAQADAEIEQWPSAAANCVFA